MAARSGMVSLIDDLRSMTSTAPDEVTINGVAYWSDEQLQARLDSTRVEYIDIPLAKLPLRVAGETTFTRYYIPQMVNDKLETAETTGAFTVVDIQGYSAPSYTYDASSKLILFAADTGGIEYYLRARGYDLDYTASQIWFEKAGHRVSLIEWKAGAHSMKEDDEYNHCIEMANRYSRKNGLQFTRLTGVGYNSVNPYS